MIETSSANPVEPEQRRPPRQPDRDSPDWWNERYRSGDTPWDTGQVPPEVTDLVSRGTLTPGWALDIGCGRGTSSRFLAAHGFRVIGIDLSAVVLGDAARLAAEAAVPAFFCAADAAGLCFLATHGTFALDIGCYHGLSLSARARYAGCLARFLVPGAYYLLYGLLPSCGDDHGPPGLEPADVGKLAPCFHLRWAQHGRDRDRPSAWYLLQRTAVPGALWPPRAALPG